MVLLSKLATPTVKAMATKADERRRESIPD
jgi:hypothetical protein